MLGAGQARWRPDNGKTRVSKTGYAIPAQLGEWDDFGWTCANIRILWYKIQSQRDANMKNKAVSKKVEAEIT